jgi:polysaccharide export outer membrane protein
LVLNVQPGNSSVRVGVIAVTRVALQFKTAAVVLLAMLGIAMISPAAQTDQPPLPKELVQYIREAKQRGEEADKLKRQAVAAGWSATDVDQAIAKDKTVKSAEPPAPPTVAAPQAPPSAPSPLQPVAPATPSVEGPDRTPPAGARVSRGVSDDYLIGSGDTLQVAVWKELEVSVPSAVVRPDGRITVPLIKEVEVAGLTPRQAETVIAEGLGKFITDPNVTVVIAAINSKKIYVIGAVRREGTLPYTYGMTVMQALSEAGGLNDYAKRKKIYILRTESGKEYRLDFNYDEVVKGERMEQNILLLPSDTLVIPH